MTTIFKVGDKVIYNPSPKDYIATIIEVTKTTVTARFLWKASNMSAGIHTFPLTAFSLAPPPLSKEESLNLKCKTLWNNSKYIKKNPKYAY